MQVGHRQIPEQLVLLQQVQGGQLHGVADGAMRHAGDRVGQLQWPAELEQVVKFGVCRIGLAGLLFADLVTWQQPDAFYWPDAVNPLGCRVFGAGTGQCQIMFSWLRKAGQAKIIYQEVWSCNGLIPMV